MNKNDLAKNPNTSVGTLDRVSYDESYFVRCFVASDDNTPPETLDRLASDEDYDVRSFVASNPNTSQYIKDLLKFKKWLSFYPDL